MGDFVIVGREYPGLTQLLLEQAPGFGESAEFRQLETPDLELPSVVCGAFRRYVERVHLHAYDSESVDPRLSEAVRAMERLASSDDPEVANALIVDVYEHLDLPDEVLDDFYSGLGPSARALYDRWIGPPGGRSR